jgi:cold shock CspA family protein
VKERSGERSEEETEEEGEDEETDVDLRRKRGSREEGIKVSFRQVSGRRGKNAHRSRNAIGPRSSR